MRYDQNMWLHSGLTAFSGNTFSRFITRCVSVHPLHRPQCLRVCLIACITWTELSTLMHFYRSSLYWHLVDVVCMLHVRVNVVYFTYAVCLIHCRILVIVSYSFPWCAHTATRFYVFALSNSLLRKVQSVQNATMWTVASAKSCDHITGTVV